MFSADRYTKVVLTVIALCLAVLCVEGAHWSRVDTVQAQSAGVLIRGYIINEGGRPKTVLLDSNSTSGIPVIVTNNY
jgi:hypothetical protein